MGDVEWTEGQREKGGCGDLMGPLRVQELLSFNLRYHSGMLGNDNSDLDFFVSR